MKILVIPSWYPANKTSHGGSFFREQAIALQNAGNEVVVCNASFSSRKNWFDTKNYKLTKYIDEGVVVYSLINPLFGIGRSKKILNAIYKMKLNYLLNVLQNELIGFDIIHAHSYLPAGYVSTKFAKKLNIPIVITEHSSAIMSGVLSKYEKYCLTETIKNSNQFICVSSSLKNKVENITGKGEKIIVIPNMVSPIFNLNYSVNNDDKFIFLSVGNFNSRKRFKLTIRAFTEAFHDNKLVKLQLVGGGPLYNELKEYVSCLGMNDSIEILGSKTREDISILMKNCDVFVLPSTFETFGVVYIEAFACGKPVIATRNGGADYLVNNKNGILIDVDNLQQLINAMRYINKNINEYDKKYISSECLKQYSQESIVSKLTNLYVNTLKEGR